jgi:hypothetical protein
MQQATRSERFEHNKTNTKHTQTYLHQHLHLPRQLHHTQEQDGVSYQKEETNTTRKRDCGDETLRAVRGGGEGEIVETINWRTRTIVIVGILT